MFSIAEAWVSKPLLFKHKFEEVLMFVEIQNRGWTSSWTTLTQPIYTLCWRHMLLLVAKIASKINYKTVLKIFKFEGTWTPLLQPKRHFHWAPKAHQFISRYFKICGLRGNSAFKVFLQCTHKGSGLRKTNCQLLKTRLKNDWSKDRDRHDSMSERTSIGDPVWTPRNPQYVNI